MVGKGDARNWDLYEALFLEYIELSPNTIPNNYAEKSRYLWENEFEIKEEKSSC